MLNKPVLDGNPNRPTQIPVSWYKNQLIRSAKTATAKKIRIPKINQIKSENQWSEKINIFERHKNRTQKNLIDEENHLEDYKDFRLAIRTTDEENLPNKPQGLDKENRPQEYDSKNFIKNFWIKILKPNLSFFRWHTFSV